MTHPSKWAGQPSRHERGYDSKWIKRRKRILARDRHLCVPCLALGVPTPAREVDHITPKAKGGTDDDWNLQSICVACHKEKSAQEARNMGQRMQRRDGW